MGSFVVITRNLPLQLTGAGASLIECLLACSCRSEIEITTYALLVAFFATYSSSSSLFLSLFLLRRLGCGFHVDGWMV